MRHTDKDRDIGRQAEEPELNEERYSQDLKDERHSGKRISLAEIIPQVIEVLESDTVYSTALEANIEAFHDAVRTEKKLQSIHEEMSERFQRLEERINGLEGENQALKDKLEDSEGSRRDQPPLEGTG